MANPFSSPFGVYALPFTASIIASTASQSHFASFKAGILEKAVNSTAEETNAFAARGEGDGAIASHHFSDERRFEAMA